MIISTKTDKRIMKKTFTIAAVLLLIASGYSQEVVEIEGPSPVSQGSTHWYILEMENLPPFAFIEVTGGGTLLQTVTSPGRWDMQIQ